VTAILPHPAAAPVVSEEDRLRREVQILRAQLAAVVDDIVHDEMTPHRNKAEHPFTDAELAAIEARYRRHWAQVALNASQEQNR
jgi:hypothetical protein